MKLLYAAVIPAAASSRPGPTVPSVTLLINWTPALRKTIKESTGILQLQASHVPHARWPFLAYLQVDEQQLVVVILWQSHPNLERRLEVHATVVTRGLAEDGEHLQPVDRKAGRLPEGMSL